jgi:hypothetical protein
MSVTGQKRRFDRRPMTSGLPRGTDLVRPTRHVTTCQQQTRAQQITSLFDHLVGLGEQRRRYDEAERFSSLKVDYEIELLWPLYW